jgi:hypothetical protein
MDCDLPKTASLLSQSRSLKLAYNMTGSLSYFFCSDEYRRMILSFLWFVDIFHCGLINKESWNLIFLHDKNLAYNLLNSLLRFSQRKVDFILKSSLSSSSFQQPSLSPRNRRDSYYYNLKEVLYLSAKLTPWPTGIALDHHETPSRNTYQIIEMKSLPVSTSSSSSSSSSSLSSPGRSSVVFHEGKSVTGSRSRYFCYQGKVVGRNRAVVANDHFPVVFPSRYLPVIKSRDSRHHTVQIFSSLPYTKIIYDNYCHFGHFPQLIPLSSHIAYYEITIHPACPPSLNSNPNRNSTAENSNNDDDNDDEDSSYWEDEEDENEEQDELFHQPPCVCIGLARPGFDIYTMMPGWNEHSFAFHGDDGLFFCGDSEHGYPPLKNRSLNRFGCGDTVGFGLIYPLVQTQKNPKNGKIFRQTFLSAQQLSSSEEIDEEEEKGEIEVEKEKEKEKDCGFFFFTKNGILQALIPLVDSSFFEYSWFPAIGTDCYNPIETNFGCDNGKGFVFDVIAFEKGHNHDQSASSSLKILPEIKNKRAYQRLAKKFKSLFDDYLFSTSNMSSSSSSSAFGNKDIRDSFSRPSFIYPAFYYPVSDWRTRRRPMKSGQIKESEETEEELEKKSKESVRNRLFNETASIGNVNLNHLNGTQLMLHLLLKNTDITPLSSYSVTDTGSLLTCSVLFCSVVFDFFLFLLSLSLSLSPSLSLSLSLFLSFYLSIFLSFFLPFGNNLCCSLDPRGLFHHKQLFALTKLQFGMEKFGEDVCFLIFFFLNLIAK